MLIISYGDQDTCELEQYGMVYTLESFRFYWIRNQLTPTFSVRQFFLCSANVNLMLGSFCAAMRDILQSLSNMSSVCLFAKCVPVLWPYQDFKIFQDFHFSINSLLQDNLYILAATEELTKTN